MTPLFFPKKTRYLFGGALLLLTAVVVALFMAIAFYYESPSILYKSGLDKTLLRAGKVVGLAVFVLLFLQLPTVARSTWLDRIISLPALYRAHRFNAYCIGLLIAAHPVLVQLPDDRVLIPLETRYWPDWIGAGLLFLLFVQIVLSQWRELFFRQYENWRRVHRITGTVALILLAVHVLYVSETFEREGAPRTGVLAFVVFAAALWIWIRLRGPLTRRTFIVHRIDPAGDNAHTLTLVPSSGKNFRYLPGQFAFLSIQNKKIPAQYHPFTISSSPTHFDSLRFTIRRRGDWTNRIPCAQIGDTVYVQGPYGCFSHVFTPTHRDIIMVAGGIGVTPMLSMLRHMRDTRDKRRILLLWSNQTNVQLFSARELTAMTRELTDFKWIPIFTRRDRRQGLGKRLDRNMLTNLLQGYGRDADVFICGPRPMMLHLNVVFRELGFSKSSIKSETFGF